MPTRPRLREDLEGRAACARSSVAGGSSRGTSSSRSSFRARCASPGVVLPEDETLALYADAALRPRRSRSRRCAGCASCSQPPIRQSAQAGMVPLLGAALLVVLLAAVGYLVHRRRDLGHAGRPGHLLHTASLAAPGLRAGLTEAGCPARRAAPAHPARHLGRRADRRLANPAPSTASRATGRRSHRCTPGPSSPAAPPRSSAPTRSVVRLARLPGPGRHAPRPIVDGDAVVGALVAYGRDSHGHAGPGGRGGRALGVRASSSSARPRPSALYAHGGRAAGAAGQDQPALHLQLAHRPSPRSPAPIPTALGSCSWSSPTSPDTRCAAPGSSPPWPRSCATPSDTWCWNRPDSASACGYRCGSRRRSCQSSGAFLVVQPLVENAVRHGLRGQDVDGGHRHDHRG